MRLTRLIDFRGPTSRWREVEHFIGEYHIRGKNLFSLKFVECEGGDLKRKVADVYEYQKNGIFIAQEIIFFEKFPIIQLWGEMEASDHPFQDCSVGFGEKRWLLEDYETFRFENVNQQKKIPPPAIIVGIYDTIRDRYTKRVFVTPLGGQIL